MSAGWLGTGWGARESSLIARHEWKGLSKMAYRLQDHVEKQRQEMSDREERAQRRSLLREGTSMPGAFDMDEDDEDEDESDSE